MSKVLEYLMQREARFQILYTVLTGIILSVSGMQIGYSSVTLQFIKNPTTGIGLDDEMATLFTSVPSITNLVGCLASIFVLRYGRRKTILMGDISFVIGWILLASSNSVAQLLSARVILGFAVGISLTTNQMYISEILSIHLTRILNPSTSFFISVGFIVVYSLGYVIKGNWRLIAIICTIITIISLILTFLFLPESPRWLLMEGRKVDAKKALLKLRGCKEETEDFKTEFTEMINYSKSKYSLKKKISIEDNLNTSDLATISEYEPTNLKPEEFEKKRFPPISIKNIWMDLLSSLRYFKLPEVWKPFLILNVFFLLNNFSGTVVLMTYTVNIVEKTSTFGDSFLVTIVIGVCQIIGDVLLICCSLRMGRRTMAITSGIVVSVSLITLGIYNQYFNQNGFSSIPLICLFLYVILGKMGFVDLPWTLLGELFPTKFIRFLAPLLVCCAGIYEFLSLQSYPKLVNIGFPFTVYLYSASAIILTIFLSIELPETAGKTKAEIEEEFKK